MTTKNVLIVDDDEALLEGIVKGLETILPAITVYAARSVSEAIGALAARPFSLVVTDLVMPGSDGFELLAHLSRHHGRIPVIVMSGHFTPSRRQRALDLGGLWCLEKPVRLQELADVVGALISAGPPSHLHGVSVASFLQLLEIEKKTGTITARHDGTVGRLYLQRGKVIHAECAMASGIEAAYKLVHLDEASIEFTGVLATREKTIDQSMETILLEAFRLADEAKSGTGNDRCAGANAHPVTSALGQELQALATLPGFIAAAVFSGDMGVVAQLGDGKLLDSELCLTVSSYFGGIETLLLERSCGRIHSADLVTSSGQFLSLRSVPGGAELCLLTLFSGAVSLGLLHHRLRDVVMGLQAVGA